MALGTPNQNDAGKPKRLQFVNATLKELDLAVRERGNPM